MKSLYSTDYEKIEISLEKVRTIFSRGLVSESLRLLNQLLTLNTNLKKDVKEFLDLENIFNAEKVLIYVDLENFSEAFSILTNLKTQKEIKDDDNLIGSIAINQAWSYYQLTKNNLDDGLKTATDILDILETNEILKTSLNGFFYSERVAFSEYLVSFGYWLKGNLHIANEFGKSCLEKFRDNQSVRILIALNHQSNILRSLGQLETSVEYCKEAFLRSLIQFNQKIQPVLLNNMGLTFIKAGYYQKAERVFRNGMIASDDTYDFKIKSTILLNLAEIQSIRGAITEAEESFREILKIVRQNPSLKEIEGFALMNLGKISLQARKYPQAARHFESSLRIMEFIKDEKNISELLAYYARNLAILKNFETAEQLITRAKSLAMSLGHDSLLPLIYISEGIYYRISNGLNYPQTIETFEKGYQKAKEQGNHLRTLEAAMYLAEIYLSREKPNFYSAKQYLFEAIKLATEGDVVPLIVRGLLLSATIKATELNFGLALEDLKKAEDAARDVNLTEELFDIENLRGRVKQQIPYLQWISEEDLTQDPSLMLSLIVRITKRIPDDISLKTTSLLMYHFTNEGPTVLHTSNSSALSQVTISTLGLVLSMTIGQGHSHFKGLFGPLPIQKTDFDQSESLVLCFTTFLEDEKADHRLKGQNFIIFAFVYDKRIERRILYDRRKIEDVFRKYSIDYPQKADWKDSLVDKLRKEVIEAFLK